MSLRALVWRSVLRLHPPGRRTGRATTEQEELPLSVIRKLLSLRAARAVVTNPVEALAVPELFSMRHDYPASYKPDPDWEVRPHRWLGAAWPCPERGMVDCSRCFPAEAPPPPVAPKLQGFPALPKLTRAANRPADHRDVHPRRSGMRLTTGRSRGGREGPLRRRTFAPPRFPLRRRSSAALELAQAQSTPHGGWFMSGPRSQQFFHRDGQIADAPAGGVEHRICDRGGYPDDHQLAESLGADRVGDLILGR
jgi:hypothetical protein